MHANQALLECLVRDRLAEARADTARHRLARRAFVGPPRIRLHVRIGGWLDRAMAWRFPGRRPDEAGVSLRGA